MIEETLTRVTQFNLSNINHEIIYNNAINDKFVKVSIIAEEFDKAGRYQVVCKITGPKKIMEERYNAKI